MSKHFQKIVVAFLLPLFMISISSCDKKRDAIYAIKMSDRQYKIKCGENRTPVPKYYDNFFGKEFIYYSNSSNFPYLHKYELKKGNSIELVDSVQMKYKVFGGFEKGIEEFYVLSEDEFLFYNSKNNYLLGEDNYVLQKGNGIDHISVTDSLNEENIWCFSYLRHGQEIMYKDTFLITRIYFKGVDYEKKEYPGFVKKNIYTGNEEFFWKFPKELIDKITSVNYTIVSDFLVLNIPAENKLRVIDLRTFEEKKIEINNPDFDSEMDFEIDNKGHRQFEIDLYQSLVYHKHLDKYLLFQKVGEPYFSDDNMFVKDAKSPNDKVLIFNKDFKLEEIIPIPNSRQFFFSIITPSLNGFFDMYVEKEVSIFTEYIIKHK